MSSQPSVMALDREYCRRMGMSFCSDPLPIGVRRPDLDWHIKSEGGVVLRSLGLITRNGNNVLAVSLWSVCSVDKPEASFVDQAFDRTDMCVKDRVVLTAKARANASRVSVSLRTFKLFRDAGDALDSRPVINAVNHPDGFSDAMKLVFTPDRPFESAPCLSDLKVVPGGFAVFMLSWGTKSKPDQLVVVINWKEGTCIGVSELQK